MLLFNDHDSSHVIVDTPDECPDASGVRSTREQVLQLPVDHFYLGFPNPQTCVIDRPEINIAENTSSVVYSDLLMGRW
jgi:hypothetical protein